MCLFLNWLDLSSTYPIYKDMTMHLKGHAWFEQSGAKEKIKTYCSWLWAHALNHIKASFSVPYHSNAILERTF